jgi:hypothetical protein
MAGSARVGEASGGIMRKKSTALLTIGAGRDRHESGNP